MRHLIIDTETTGLPPRGMALSDERYPWPVEVAALLCDDELNPQARLHLLLVPPVSIPVEASKIHGVDDEKVRLFGVAMRGGLGAFVRLLSLADVVVAHNVDFDANILQSACERSGVPFAHALPAWRCTAKEAAPIVNLPPTERMVAAGINRPKTPTLTEALRAVCGVEHSGAHTALADTIGCRDLYAALLARGCWSGKEAA